MNNNYKTKIIIFVAILAGFVVLSLPNFKNNEQTLKFSKTTQDTNASKDTNLTLSQFFLNSNINFDKNLTTDVATLQNLVRDFLLKNEILIKDNIAINEKNLTLSLMVDELKNRLQTQKEDIKSQNDALLKEQQEQHYQNIKELTDKLKESQVQNLESIKNYEKKISKLENEKLFIISDYDKNISSLVSKKDQEIANLLAKNDSLKSMLKENFKDINKTKQNDILIKKDLNSLKNELLLSKKEIDNLNFLHKKELDRLSNGYNIQRLTLEDELSKKSNIIVDLKVQLEDKNIQIQKNIKTIDFLKNDIKLKNLKIEEIERNASTLRVKIEKNAELFNALNSENLSIKTLMLDIKKDLDLKNRYISNLEENLTKLTYSIKAKNNEIDILKTASKTDMKNYEILKAQIDMLKKDNNSAPVIADNVKNISDSELLKRIKELEDEITLSIDKQDKLEDENINLKNILETQTKLEVPKKLIFVSQIQCDDILKDGVTSLCKNRVSSFLSRYNSNYLYEVIAMVDNRGYSLPYEISSKISKSELNRLNGYVDYGVGKERASFAAALIKDEFGDFARISFSPDVIKNDNSRGFVIKVYR